MIFRLLVFSTLLLLNAPELAAQGGNKTQFLPEDVGANNSDFSNCSSTLTNGVYYITCSGNVILPNGNNNWVELNETPVNLSISGDLTLGGTDINTQGNQSDLTITISGNLNPGNNGNVINANMTIAGSINAGNNTDISGGLTISGNVNLGNNSSIEGDVQVSGDLNTGTNVTISGNVDAGGNINIGQNNNISGDISADTININGNNSVITGNVQAENDLNNNGSIIGNVNVNGNLNNNGSIEGEYVNAPCTETNSCGGTIDVDLTCNTENIDENTSACEPEGDGTEIHSLLLTHSGTALTCEAYPITITACADASCTPVTLSIGEVDIDIGSQSATASFNNTSSATVNFDLTSPGGYSLSVENLTDITTTNSPQFSPSNQVTAVDTALRFSSEQTQLSGTDFILDLEAIRKDTDTGACVAAFNTTKAVEFSLICEDPTACTESINIEGTPVNSTTAIDVDFTNGSGSITTSYPDVGRIRLQASAQGETAAILNGSSQAFVVKPYGVGFEVLDGIAANGAGSAATYAGDEVFERAGQPFTVNLSAINEDGSVAPSFGQESVTETLEVKTHALLAPTGDSTNTANEGDLFINGNQVAYSEVGVIELEAGLIDNDYLGSGAIPNNTSQPIGRFIPDRFAQFNGDLFGACGASNFYYMGQEQRFDVKLMAVNTEGDLTQNYYGDFAKGTPEFYAFTLNDEGNA
ncbi:MAG: polymer-forming cytoskeletal protein, partial [Actinobacteria bacterium]|nr:polymer-forming cytoskeletal protein [Actinomycetota bacterium]